MFKYNHTSCVCYIGMLLEVNASLIICSQTVCDVCGCVYAVRMLQSCCITRTAADYTKKTLLREVSNTYMSKYGM